MSARFVLPAVTSGKKFGGTLVPGSSPGINHQVFYHRGASARDGGMRQEKQRGGTRLVQAERAIFFLARLQSTAIFARWTVEFFRVFGP